MKKKVEELLKQAKTAKKNNKVDFQKLVHLEHANNNITSYDASYLLDAYEYFLKGTRCLPAYRTAWAQGYIRKDEDGKIELYTGRLGYGYIEHIRSERSSRYHLICYHIIAY